MPLYWIYPIYTSVLAVTMIVLVPRDRIRRLLYFGLLLGGVADVLAIFLVTHLLGAGGYLHYGPFAFGGVPFFPPLAWSIWFVMYFYFLPRHGIQRLVYIVSAAGYAVLLSNIISNLGIFQWNYGEVLVPFFIYATWFTVVTYARDGMAEVEFAFSQ